MQNNSCLNSWKKQNNPATNTKMKLINFIQSLDWSLITLFFLSVTLGFVAAHPWILTVIRDWIMQWKQKTNPATHKNMNDKFQVGHVGWSPDYKSNKSKPIVFFKADRIDKALFIYTLNGVIKCYFAGELDEEEEATLLKEGWQYTTVIDPALWIEAMANGYQEPSDMLDELQFLPTC